MYYILYNYNDSLLITLLLFFFELWRTLFLTEEIPIELSQDMCL